MKRQKVPKVTTLATQLLGSQLPEDVLVAILSYIRQVDRLSLRASCSLLRTIHDRWVKVLCFHSASWRYLLAHEFPNIHSVALKSQPSCFSFTFARSWLFGVCTLSLSFTAPVTAIPVLAQMPNLTDLSFEGPQVGCDVAREVLALTKLKALSFVDVGSSLCTWLTVLCLQRISLPVVEVPSIVMGQLVGLTKLQLACVATPGGVSAHSLDMSGIANQTNLASLRLQNVHVFQAQALEKLTRMKKLDFVNVSIDVLEGLGEILISMPSLRALRLVGDDYFYISKTTIPMLSNISSLVLQNFRSNFLNSSLALLARGSWISMRTLILDGSCINSHSLSSVVNSCQMLQRLSLHNCDQLSDPTCLHHLTSLTSLYHLRMRCGKGKRFPDNGLAVALCSRLPCLHIFDMQKCATTEDDKIALRAIYKHIVIK